MLKIIVFVAVYIFGFAFFEFNAFALQSSPAELSSARCYEKAGGVTAEVRKCQEMEFKKLDVELNSAFQKLLKTIEEKERQTALRSSERAWLSFEKAECDFRGLGEKGGSIAPIIIDGCHIEMTKQRINDLKAALNREA